MRHEEVGLRYAVSPGDASSGRAPVGVAASIVETFFDGSAERAGGRVRARSRGGQASDRAGARADRPRRLGCESGPTESRPLHGRFIAARSNGRHGTAIRAARAPVATEPVMHQPSGRVDLLKGVGCPAPGAGSRTLLLRRSSAASARHWVLAVGDRIGDCGRPHSTCCRPRRDVARMAPVGPLLLVTRSRRAPTRVRVHGAPAEPVSDADGVGSVVPRPGRPGGPRPGLISPRGGPAVVSGDVVGRLAVTIWPAGRVRGSRCASASGWRGPSIERTRRHLGRRRTWTPQPSYRRRVPDRRPASSVLPLARMGLGMACLRAIPREAACRKQPRDGPAAAVGVRTAQRGRARSARVEGPAAARSRPSVVRPGPGG